MGTVTHARESRGLQPMHRRECMGTVLMHERECRCLEPVPTWGNAWGHACKVRRGGHAAARAWALNLHKNTCKVRKGRHATARAWALDLRKNTCTGPAVANVCQHGRMGRGGTQTQHFAVPPAAWGSARTCAPRCMGRRTHPAPCCVPAACGRAPVPPEHTPHLSASSRSRPECSCRSSCAAIG